MKNKFIGREWENILKRKCIAIILIIIILNNIFYPIVFAIENNNGDIIIEISKVVYINGEKVEENRVEENWEYYEETNTLILNNYSSCESYNEGEYNIYAEGDLNLILNGTNTITSESNSSILVEGKLNILGTGTLELNGYKETGIKVRKDLKVQEDVKITTESENIILNTIGKDIIIESGKIEAPNSDIVSSNGQIIIKNGNVTTNNIKATQKLTIENGKIEANEIYSSKEMEITGGELHCKAIKLDLYMPLTIRGGKINISGNDIGINTAGKILIEGGDINVEGTDIAIYGGQLKLQMTGGKLVAKGGRIGIEKNIEISGGELYAIGETEYGITEVSGDHIISGGYVEATGGKIGIRSEWTGEKITGGKVKVSGNEYGIYAGNTNHGTIEISNCEAEIYGGKQALYSTEGVTISDGLYYKTGTSKENAHISSGYYFEQFLYLNILTKYINDLDDKTSISLEGAIDKNAKFEVNIINNVEEIYKEMLDENIDLSKYNLKAYNIELIDGEYEGELTLTFNLGIENNNKNVQIWHKTHSGNIETFNEIVIDGKVTIEVQELSPFAVFYEKNYLKGDVNNDGKLNIKDWNKVYNHINETSTLSDEEFERGDVNKDGKVNIKDWNRMYDHITEVNPLW